MSTPSITRKHRNSVIAGRKLRGAEKLARIPVKVQPSNELPRKPHWIRVRLPSGDGIARLRDKLRSGALSTVCEEASCPNLPECFGHGTATFLIMGDICTRRCPFCDVAHGRPLALDAEEPARLAETVSAMGLRYLVITSVDRDDLRDGGASHFAACIRQTRRQNPGIQVEVLVPDFRGRMDVALDHLKQTPPDVFNHNLETVPRLYREARPGADYRHSLALIRSFKRENPAIPTKSGLMLGLGEDIEEIKAVMLDLRASDCDRLTVGQYLQPSVHHLPVRRFVPPEEFDALRRHAQGLGFSHVASAPLVRSSFHADLQASGRFDDALETSL